MLSNLCVGYSKTSACGRDFHGCGGVVVDVIVVVVVSETAAWSSGLQVQQDKRFYLKHRPQESFHRETKVPSRPGQSRSRLASPANVRNQLTQPTSTDT